VPIETIPMANLKSFIKTNKDYHYPNRKTKNRLEPVCRPRFNPSFQIEDHDKVFAMGSCFAFNIQQELLSAGINILPLTSVSHLEDGFSGLMNQYSPITIMQSFKWALEPLSMPKQSSCFMDMENGYMFDPTLHGSSRKKETIISNNNKITKINAMVKECRIVIITLGLIECFYDKKLGIYLNGFPMNDVYKIEKGRYEIRVLNYPEILESLEELHRLLSRNLTDDYKILMTVSPVPLVYTFRKSDVVEANTYSKSVLRAAAEEFSNKHSNVDYLPIYESVSLSDRVVAWDWDLRHVSNFIVKVNIIRMLAAYLTGEKAKRFKSEEEEINHIDVKYFEEQFNERIPENIRLMDQEFYNRELEQNQNFAQKVNQSVREKVDQYHDIHQLELEALKAKVGSLQNTNTRYLKQILDLENNQTNYDRTR
jgi:hypothetical protein